MKLIEYKMDREAGRARSSGSLWCCEIAGREKKLPKKAILKSLLNGADERQMIIERDLG